MDPEQIAALREELNRPIWEQFLTYIRNPFDPGIDSTRFSQPGSLPRRRPAWPASPANGPRST